MYRVTTLEKWKSHITASTYNFSNVHERDKFIEMCKEDKVFILVYDSQIAI